MRFLAAALMALCCIVGAVAAPASEPQQADSLAAARADSILRALPPEYGVDPDAYDGDDISISEFSTAGGRLDILATDTLPVIAARGRFDGYNIWEEREVEYNPQPNRAVWMSALFPGLGQVYNRRYWKLPIVVGGYLGLAYATSWNNGMLTDYTRAYRDIMDTDPSTNSYMNFFPPTISEDNIDKSWLTNILRTRRDYFRRNRDLCIICLVALYLVCMVDAYVDASMAHFDVSPDLSLDIAPAIIVNDRFPSIKRSALGLQWSLTF